MPVKINLYSWKCTPEFSARSPQPLRNEFAKRAQRHIDLLRDPAKAKDLLKNFDYQELLNIYNGTEPARVINQQPTEWMIATLSVIQAHLQILNNKQLGLLTSEIVRGARFVLMMEEDARSDFAIGFIRDKTRFLHALAHELGHNMVYFESTPSYRGSSDMLRLRQWFNRLIKDWEIKDELLASATSYVFLKEMGETDQAVRDLARTYFRFPSIIAKLRERITNKKHYLSQKTVIDILERSKNFNWSVFVKNGIKLFWKKPDLSFEEFRKELLPQPEY